MNENGVLSEKLPPGAARQAARLKREGHKLRRERGKWRVIDAR
jgi:hypothetical protein